MADDGVDPQTAPGDDFFRYANGAWLKTHEIPAGKNAWGARGEIAEQTRRQVLALLEDAKTAPPGSDARKLADFRAAYSDEAAIESRGIGPAQPLLDRIERIRDKAELTRFLGSELRADVDPMHWDSFDSSHLLGLAVQSGKHGEKNYVAYLLQGGLGLAERDDYLSGDAAAQARRLQYQAAIARVLARLGASDAGQRAADVMALETAIARSHATREASADEASADTVWMRDDFAREAPGIDWSAFFAAAGLSAQQSFVAWQPSAVKGAAALVASKPLDAWKDYLRVRVIARYADVLPRAFAVEPVASRAERALEVTQSAMSDTLGKVYAQRYFPAESKARVQKIVANVVAEFTQHVEAASWMSPGTRAMALAKLKVMYFGVGYPDRWPDDPALVVDAADPVGNLQRIERRNYDRALARLGRPVDRAEWAIAPQWPGAALQFSENSYNFAAALLQPPKFDPAASDAANYGAIGAIVGHEVSHFVDTLGADYDDAGRHRRWWRDADAASYDAACEPLVRQFSQYRPFADVAVDGKLGLTENLADLGGLVAAFDAYRRTLGAKVTDKDYVREQDRQFFLGFARSWRANYRDDALKAKAASDHAPESYRISTVRNLDAWYDAFDVRPGQRLYLEPKARVKIW